MSFRHLSDLDLTRLVTDAPNLAGRLDAQKELKRRDRELGLLNYNTGKRQPPKEKT